MHAITDSRIMSPARQHVPVPFYQLGSLFQLLAGSQYVSRVRRLEEVPSSADVRRLVVARLRQIDLYGLPHGFLMVGRR